MNQEELIHDPVLVNEIETMLIRDHTRIFFDGTLGLGGHAIQFLTKNSQLELYIGCDLDRQHLEFATERLSDFSAKLQLHNLNFSEIHRVVSSHEPGSLSLLFDLGICSNHVDDPTKGFSFSGDGPLNMSFSSDPTQNAEVVINTYGEEELIRVLRDYGEEPAAYKIARAIIQYRKDNPIRSTFELKSVITSAVLPKDLKKTLTRVFQALRIEVNEELHHLEEALANSFSVMESGDIMGVISYHSLEDRIVKNTFRGWSKPETTEGLYSLHEEVSPAEADLLTKKPVLPSPEEVDRNPRARSAKLRVIRKK